MIADESWTENKEHKGKEGRFRELKRRDVLGSALCLIRNVTVGKTCQDSTFLTIE